VYINRVNVWVRKRATRRQYAIKWEYHELVVVSVSRVLWQRVALVAAAVRARLPRVLPSPVRAVSTSPAEVGLPALDKHQK